MLRRSVRAIVCGALAVTAPPGLHCEPFSNEPQSQNVYDPFAEKELVKALNRTADLIEQIDFKKTSAVLSEDEVKDLDEKIEKAL